MDTDSCNVLFTSHLHVTGILAGTALTLQEFTKPFKRGRVEDAEELQDLLLQLAGRVISGLQAASGGSVARIWQKHAEAVFNGSPAKTDLGARRA
jgi:hypothetical protein